MTTRKELVAALQLRYGIATFGERIKILDEFVTVTGYHRKHAIRLLREEPGAAKGDARAQPAVRRGGTPGADGVVGSSRPGLRQATEGVDPKAG